MKLTALIILMIGFSMLNAQDPSLIIPVGHTTSVLSADISPDGQKYLNTSYDGTAKMWNKGGSELYTVHGFDRFAKQASFNKTGEYFLVRYEKTVAVYRVQTGELVSSFTKSSGIESARFTKNGDKIFFTTYFTAGIFEAVTGDHVYETDLEIEKIVAADLSSDESTIAVVQESVGITIEQVISDGKNDKFSIPGIEFTSINFSPDGKSVAAGANDGHIRVWNLEKNEIIIDRPGHTNPIISIQYNNTGTKLVSAGEDEVIIFWDAPSGDSLFVLRDTDNRQGAFFNPSSDKVLSYASWGLQVWDVNTGSLLYKLDIDRHTGSRNDVNLTNVQHAAFSPDGTRIISSSSDCTSIVWDANTGAFLTGLKGEVIELSSQVYSKKNKILVTGQIDGYVRFWKTDYGQLLKSSNKHNSWITDLALSWDESKVATVSKSGQLSIWETSSGTLLNQLDAHDNWAVDVKFSFDGKKIITGSWDKTAALWDVATGKLILRMNKHKENVDAVNISRDGRYALTASWDSTIQIWQTNERKLFKTLRAETSLTLPRISLDNRFVVAGGGGMVYCWDFATGKLLYTKHFGTQVIDLEITEDGKRISVLYSGNPQFFNDQPGQFSQYDLATGKEVLEIESPGENGDPVSFSADDKNKQYLIATSNGKVTLHSLTEAEKKENEIHTNSTGWNYAFFTGENDFGAVLNFGARFFDIVRERNAPPAIKELYTSIALDTINYLTYIPSGYYQCSPVAAKLLHYVTKDLQVITFEQLDVKYNRPDKVLEEIGNTDTALINSYRKAWEKRIKKLGIDTTAFRDGYSVPEADFTNRDAIEYEQKTGTFKLLIKGDDSTYKLDRFNVWVNETPIFGQRGINIRKRNKNDFDTTITIKLSQGENRIETSITNVNGTESYRMPLTVNYSPAVKQKESLRFIGIGIDQFADSQYNLQYSAKDIRDLSKKLKEKYGNDIIIDTLFNENVTVSNVKALKQKLQQTSVNDKVIVSYSGHGMLSKDYDYYLSTYSVNFQKPEENGLAYDELENLLDSIPARKKLMFIDACHSGEVDNEEGIAMQKMADSLGLKKGIIIDDSTTQTQHLGLKNSFELMQSLFVNVGKSTGATIISAAAGNQFALERGDLKNGVFTYSILEAMEKNKTMKISELKKTVGERVGQLTSGLQKPTSRNETIAVDWSLW